MEGQLAALIECEDTCVFFLPSMICVRYKIKSHKKYKKLSCEKSRRLHGLGMHIIFRTTLLRIDLLA